MKQWIIGLWLCLGAICYAESISHHHSMLYPSVDQNGDSVTLSGLISVPTGPAKGIMLVTHYTICAQEESPSIQMTDDAEYFEDKYVLIVPDYIGYGVTSDRIHPYLHGPLTARNSLDMLLNAGQVLDSMGVTLPHDSIYIMGYSQGGATALWTLKLIEEEYADKIHVIRCFAGDGPYDVAATYDVALERNHVGLPIVIPMLVLGTNEAYGLGWSREDYFTTHMERVYSRYIEKKEFGVVKLFFKTLNHRLSHWLKPEAMDKNHAIGAQLYAALQRSSLVTADHCPSWTPKSEIYVFHSSNDDVVTFRCAENLQRCYPNLPNITYDFGRYGNHLYASKHFFKRVQEMLR